MRNLDGSNCGKRLSLSLERNLSEIKRIFGGSSDLNVLRARIGRADCAVLTLEGMVSSSAVSDMLLEPLMRAGEKRLGSQAFYDYISKSGMFSTEQKQVLNFDEAAKMLCSGFALVMTDGVSRALCVSAQGFQTRAVSEPESESNIKGAHEALSDNLRTSMSLIRRRVKSPLLRFEFLRAGTLADIELCVVYIAGKTPKKLRDEVKARIRKMDLELILTSGSIIPFVSKSKGAFFSEASTTERPDVIAAKVNEGRIALLIDGVPYAVLFPTLFAENFQTVDDYEEKPLFAACQRIVRYIAFFIAAFLPGTYVAAAIYHSEVLSRPLLLSLIASEESTPLPLVSEMLMVIIMFEILREAGLRLPKTVGGAVSIVGGLVIGDAAVTSGLISAPLLIIIGITATSSFVLPGLNPQVTLLRLASVAAGGIAGFYGMAVLITLTLVNASSCQSYGVPYTAPFAPLTLSAVRKTVAREGFKPDMKNATIEQLVGAEGKKDDGK